MIMFTAYNSLQNIVSKIYGLYGYDNFGETSVLLTYFVFGICTFITPFFIRDFLTIVIFVQVIMAAVSIQIIDLKPKAN